MKYILDIEFQKLRREFIETLQSDIGDIEDLIVSIPKSKSPTSLFGNIMGKVHSIKGVAGSYDYTIVSSLCHIIEDHLIHTRIAEGNDWDKITDLLLRDIDELKILVLALLDNNLIQIEAIQTKYKLRHKESEVPAEGVNEKCRVLMVESSQIISKVVRETIGNANVHFAFSNSAYEALGRLLEEQFDVLITSHITNALNGLTLINTIRLEQGINKNIKTILISANDFDSIKEGFPYGPDYFLKKDLKLTSELGNIFNALKTKLESEVSVVEVIDPIRRVLLVDDSLDIHKLVEISFKKTKNIEIKTARTIKEAMILLNSFRPDLVLLDVHLDQEDGRQCFAAIRSKSENAKIPIIFLTGISEENEINELFRLGAKDVIKKPFDIKKLKNSVVQNIRQIA